VISPKEDANASRRRENSRRTPGFIALWSKLPAAVQRSAIRAFEAWCKNPSHSALDHHSLGGKSRGYHSVKVHGMRYLAVYRIESREGQETYLWEWVGTLADFDKEFPR
jgi:hypothetical protein